MGDLIEKIGRFFAEQEAQIQDSFTQVAHAPARVQFPLSEAPPVHRIPSHVHTYPPGESPVTNPVPKLLRNNSLVRRHISSKGAVEPTATTQGQSWQDGINEILDAVQPRSKAHEVSSLRSFLPLPPSRPAFPAKDGWDHRLTGGLDSWRSSSSLAVSSRDSNAKDEDLVSHASSDAAERLRKPRPPHQKHRKRPRKKRRSSNQEDDPKAVEKANAEKVAAALTLAQERAKRIQHEKLQLEREQELERQEAATRLQEQMMKIEAVRARSFRHLSSLTMTTARSALSNCESDNNNHDNESVWTADTNDMMEPLKSASQFMIELEAQLRGKMSLEMHVKQSYIEKHKQRERVRLKLDKVLQQNAVQSSMVARLSATKASLEMELAAVREDIAQTRQQRRELELADEKERRKRQREAERALQIRLCEEEWNIMMEEEKERSQVAAEARAKASKRVEAHSAKLRKMMQPHRYEPRHSVSSDALSSARGSNNDSDHSGDENSRPSIEGKPLQPFKMDFFLPPELADFEEDGLCNNNERLKLFTTNEDNNDTSDVPFRWQVSDFHDSVKFTKILFDMVSDDED